MYSTLICRDSAKLSVEVYDVTHKSVLLAHYCAERVVGERTASSQMHHGICTAFGCAGASQSSRQQNPSRGQPETHFLLGSSEIRHCPSLVGNRTFQASWVCATDTMVTKDERRGKKIDTCCEESTILGENSLARYFSACGDATRTNVFASVSQARRLMARGSPSSSNCFGSCVCSSLIFSSTLFFRPRHEQTHSGRERGRDVRGT